MERVHAVALLLEKYEHKLVIIDEAIRDDKSFGLPTNYYEGIRDTISATIVELRHIVDHGELLPTV